MDWATLILSLLTLFFGGCNILQLINNRQLRKKLEAEADQEETKSLRLIIEGNVAEIARLQQRVDDYAVRYDNLLTKYSELQKELFNMRVLIGK